MRFSWGATRFVVLVGPWAIKIARFRPFRMVGRCITHLLHGEAREKIAPFSTNPFVAAFKYVFSGPLVNWSEYRLYQDSPRSFLVPTIYSLGGFVNFQKRGTKVTQAELDFGHPFRPFLAEMPRQDVEDMTKAENFCWYEGHICLCDYGGREGANFLGAKPSLEVAMVA